MNQLVPFLIFLVFSIRETEKRTGRIPLVKSVGYWYSLLPCVLSRMFWRLDEIAPASLGLARSSAVRSDGGNVGSNMVMVMMMNAEDEDRSKGTARRDLFMLLRV